MKAMAMAIALRVGESGFANGCRKVGDAIDYVIPIVLFVIVVASLGSIALGFVQ